MILQKMRLQAQLTEALRWVTSYTSHLTFN